MPSVTPQNRARPVGTRHLPLRHAVLEEVRQRIIDHMYEPGEKLFEDQLAAELEVSRNPVREALQALAGEGFVELEPRRGARVAVVSPTRARELFEIREALEGLVARLAARRRSEADVAELHELVQQGRQLATSSDLAELPALNTRFHGVLAQAAGNGALAEAIEHSQHMIEWIYSQSLRQRAPESWDEHGGIVAAVAGGDETEAERIARAHIDRARAAFVPDEA